MPSLIQFIQYLLFHTTERRKNMSIAKKAALGRQSNPSPISNGRAKMFCNMRDAVCNGSQNLYPHEGKIPKNQMYNFKSYF